ncbi:bifunctional metallophosphatase/5'-nucleotidase [Stutzerimonas stutzeri]|uniref:bifunctional metallophosphatase/5'-nucleotidase n=1 Tax=Stutzerimonas stutzeri TaxID=316 RepID=UPI000F770DAD|nr:bifunctional metallophosphatase/5'-nucleotidase [Stutzerimonas stutzeri]MDI9738390.1 bifunctional metallophosphatase/5'-nucleotidase [Stutzerimonas stutzeri]RSH67155.1 bifunctional metallophosphatase/5'-nucleotidase [Stutzerimonas stutzeri]
MPHRRPLAQHLILAIALAIAGCTADAPREPVEVNLLALNDFHGYLLPGNLTVEDAQGQRQTIKAGGIAGISGLLAWLRKEDPQTLFIGVGDLVGGSPPVSAMWADEPSLKAMDLMGMRLSVVGNHELDRGRTELERQIAGGCESSRPDKACQFESHYAGIRFPYLAANLVDSRTGERLFPAYRIEEVQGVKIGFIGAVLKGVDAMISREAMQGLRTLDEAEAINGQVPALLEQGVQAIVAVVHQGGTSADTGEDPPCDDLRGDIVEVARRLDPRIKVMLSAHTHQRYLCQVGDVLVTQGGAYGRLMTHVTLRIDPRAEAPVAVRARNLVVDPARYPADPAIAALADEVVARSQVALERPLARLGAREVPQAVNEHGESPMGNLIADAQLAATRPLGAQVAFMNEGGIRGGLALEPGQAQVNYGQVASVQPFNNGLTLLTLSGAELRELLEQQWRGDAFNPLQPSASFSYRWDPAQPVGQRIVPGSLRLDGQPIADGTDYRIAVNSFMADGGDNLAVLTRGRARLDTGLNDLDVLIDHLQAHDRAGTPAGRSEAEGRVQRQAGALAKGDH